MLKDFPISSLYRKEVSTVSGGFFAGDKGAVFEFAALFEAYVEELVGQGFVDDDQTTLVGVINRYPRLFNVVHGDWFGAFRLFS